jgi:rfaE bifunctional protein kinase chain/domain
MKKVLVTGIFNVFHPGHVRLLKFAKNCGDKLIVGLLSDKLAGKGSFVSLNYRLENLKNNSIIDEVYTIDKSIKQFIKKFKPSVVVKGKEHETRYNEEEEELKKYGGKLIFSSGEVTFSSSDLLQKEVSESKKSIVEFPNFYLKKRNIDCKKLADDLKKFNSLRACVIGDLIIDKYLECEPLGMSREDNSIVVKPMESNLYLGGAGIVSAHCSSLGAITHFISVAGKDKNEKFATKKLKEYGVHSKLFIDESRQTTLKERYMTSNKTVFRVSHLQQRSISLKLQKQILNYLKSIIKKLDLIIFSDFNYGLLPDTLIQEVQKLAKKYKIFISADCQSSSQLGDVSKFKSVDLITPTENEARVSLKNYQDGIVVLAEKLRKKTNIKNIILTLGESGVFIHKGRLKDYENDKISSLNKNPISTSGAGDCLLAITSLALKSKLSVWEAAFLGSLGAGLQVSNLGNLPLKLKNLKIKLLENKI